MFRNVSSEETKQGSGQQGSGQQGSGRAARERMNVTDPKAMRALAHPLRLALLEAIGRAESQTLTATQASEITGESPANCAFHLRTLAKYGLIEEAGGGRGRERPWRQAYETLQFDPPWEDEQSRLAMEALGNVWLDRWLQQTREGIMRGVAYPAEWQQALMASQMDTYLTAAEAKQVQDKIHDLLEPYTKRWRDAALRPPGSLPFQLLAFGYPLTDPPRKD
jgi:predicted transcriptional regulator